MNNNNNNNNDKLATPAFEVTAEEKKTPLSESLSIINADTVHGWGITGENVVVAVLDTGIRKSHPDIGVEKVVKEKKFAEGNLDDGMGHGTAIASVITEIAPDTKLMNVKVLNDKGSGNLTNIMDGIEWAVNNNADVINMSLGSLAYCASGHATCDLLSRVEREGVISVVAAGNEGPQRAPSIPALCPPSISVGATTDNEVADFSSRGPACGNLYPNASAPGVGITAAWPPDDKKSLSGTSLSCPHVSGLMALLVQANNGKPLAKNQIDYILKNSSTDIGESGPDNSSGYGRIDCTKAMDALKTAPEPTYPRVGGIPSEILMGLGLLAIPTVSLLVE